jgi:branched-chain amino acid transport system ATP-binding protein
MSERPHALEIAGVSVRFGGRPALDAVDLTADVGRVTGLIGPNGAGKTTLFNVICGLQPALRGRVRIDGRDVTKLAPFKRARLGLARTFQRLEPFGLLTVRENVRLAADAARRSDPDRVTDDLLARLGISGLGEQRPDRLPTGQARVVELARALATGPKVLLLDEPASGQDERETAAFSAVLRDVAASGVAVVLVEHDIQLVMGVCDQIHVLDLGRVLASGTPAEVQRDEAVLAAYLGAAR